MTLRHLGHDVLLHHERHFHQIVEPSPRSGIHGNLCDAEVRLEAHVPHQLVAARLGDPNPGRDLAAVEHRRDRRQRLGQHLAGVGRASESLRELEERA